MNNDDFDKVFMYLKSVGNIIPAAKETYTLLQKLDAHNHTITAPAVVAALKQIRYASNTNEVFYFYFPIVSHILYFSPASESDILGYLIGPNFANGTSEISEMMELIPSAMQFKLKQNNSYLSEEGKAWVLTTFPSMQTQVAREIANCWKELED